MNKGKVYAFPFRIGAIMFNTIIYQNYENLKPKERKRKNTFSYATEMLVMLSQIVRIDDFKAKLGLDLDMALNVKLTDGIVGITKQNDNYYLLFNIQPCGMPGKDLRPHEVIGTYIDENRNIQTKQYTNNVDCVLWYNNSLEMPEYHVDFFSHMLTEIDTSIELNVYHARYNPFLKVENESQKQQIIKAMTQTKDGEPIVVVNANNSDWSEDDKVINVNDVKNIDKVQYLSHLFDDFQKRFSNLYGVSMNMSSKQAQQTEKEISGMEAMSWLIPVDMLTQAKEFCERMKEVYDVELTAHFGTIHELNFAKFAEDCTKDDNMNDDLHDNQKGDSENDNSERDMEPLQDEQQTNADE